MSTLPTEPDIIDDDARAYWFGVIDVWADPTGNPDGQFPPYVGIPGERLSPAEARALAANLLAAADYADGTWDGR